MRFEVANYSPDEFKDTTEVITYSLRPALAADYPKIIELLDQAALPTAGLDEKLTNFVVGLVSSPTGPRVVGSAGLEIYGCVALLRSVVVESGERGHGLAGQLVTHLLAEARRAGLTSLVLLTTTAASFFTRFGFQTVERSSLPLEVYASVEFTSACPATATAMQLVTVKD